MSSIDVFENDKKALYKYVTDAECKVFKNPEKDQSTYYLNYDDSKHLICPFYRYDSSELSIFRHEVEHLLNSDSMRHIGKIFVAAYIHSNEDKNNKNRNKLSEIDPNNYMM